MRPLLAFLATVLLSLGLAACGDSGKDASSASTTSSTAAKAGAPAQDKAVASSESHFRGDEDDDESPSNNKPKNDQDADFDNDTNENVSYYDSDDNAIRGFGHAPSATDKQAIVALANRYFAAAAAADGAKVCPLMYSIIEEAIAEDYGQPPGPAYARGKTCAVVMSKLFKHAHDQLADRVTVTGVRVNGREGRVLLGSRTMRASVILVKRERGVWKVDGLFGEPLP